MKSRVFLKNCNQESDKSRHAKNVIFLTGGVCSGVGKGIALASLAALLKTLGFKVRVKKFDPYLNIDPGTLSPYQHGEVFVTSDGVETDLDIGHYERFTQQKTKQTDYITSGRIYWEILHKERDGGYEGHTVQVFPHVTDQIQDAILKDTEDVDFLLCEIGGTIGDLEGAPIYEAARILSMKISSMFIHVAYLLNLPPSGEIKTKPVQHSVRMLLALGIQPNIIICRSNLVPQSDSWKEKIATFANLDQSNILLGKDVRNVYEMLCMYSEAGLLEKVCDHFGIDHSLQNNEQIQEYKKYAQVAATAEKVVKIALVGKYIDLEDSYKSVNEALFYAATINGSKLQINWIYAEKLLDNDDESWKLLKESDGLLVPGGFGARGAEGMILAIEYARKNDIPFLGICLGMQLMAIEFVRNVCGLKSAGSAEFDNYDHKIIDLIDNLMPAVNKYQMVSKITGFMRLGEYKSHVRSGSIFEKIYNTNEIYERFRHRYELNKKYLTMMAEHGLDVCAASRLENDEREIDFKILEKNNYSLDENIFIDGLAIHNHKFFIAAQCHPEFLTRPTTGHPLFNAFIAKCVAD